MSYELKLFTGNANRPLAEEIAQYLRVPLSDAEVSRFSDGEVYVQVNENVRGADVFVIQPTCPPVNDTLMELLIMIDALKRASAHRITAVLPYYGYARQDRKVQPRVPISAKLVADLLEAAGVDRVLALDLHAGQIQGFFNIPVDHLFAAPVIIDYLGKKDLQQPVIVSPDAGGVERARAIAKRLNASLAIIDKRRDKPGAAVAMHLIGAVGTGGGPHQGLPARGDRGHEFHSGVGWQARGAGHGTDRGAAARRSDPPHPRRRIRFDAVRVKERER
jgi:ribose-phosphate pyrophosphokinase